MRRLLRNVTVLITLAVSFTLSAQDLHFSQFNSAPLLLNPALTGVNGCSYRFAANYKTQWTNLAPYNTIAASYDMALFNEKPKSNFGGIGVSFFSDRAGDSELSTNQVNLSLSYTVLLNKRGTQSLSSGIFGGVGQRSINYSKLTFDSQFGSNGFDQNRPTLENFNRDKLVYGDIGAGFLWNYNQNEKNNYYAGFSVWHLNQPNRSFFDSQDETLYIKFTVHGGGHFAMSQQVALLPSFMILSQGPHQEYNLGTLIKIKKSIMPNENTAFYFGGWYRVLDAFILNARVDFGNFNIGFSYDLNLSKLTPASNLNGGAELSLIYTGCFPNKKNQARYCPTM